MHLFIVQKIVIGDNATITSYPDPPNAVTLIPFIHFKPSVTLILPLQLP